MQQNIAKYFSQNNSFPKLEPILHFESKPEVHVTISKQRENTCKYLRSYHDLALG